MKPGKEALKLQRVYERARMYRKLSPEFAEWAAGYGVIAHTDLTQVRVFELADMLVSRGAVQRREDVFAILGAADRLANAGMWLVVHMTYAGRVRLDGADLDAGDFKPRPEGHTGGSLNMVPAYAGYLAANALTGITRSWLMGQGHCVAAIDAVNVLVGNTTPEHAARYDLSDEGLSRLTSDFYSYAVDSDGTPRSPLGSHVNVHTAGGILEGGYLGFAELLYVHMPLPGDRLVAFLSDGAFEEQRGSDWAPRWWRAEDSGLVTPIMIANGRRIDQRTTLTQEGGVNWIGNHLVLNGFDPLTIDGRDPAAFAWAAIEAEERLTAAANAIAEGRTIYPVPLPYVIAETVKGYGFPGAGTNRAHNLPLEGNPSDSAAARGSFNAGARKLWVPSAELRQAISTMNNHVEQQRPRERDHPLAARAVPLPRLPPPHWLETESDGPTASPMEVLDQYFTQIVRSNPQLRPRVGNPDEMESNRMSATLELLRHRVTSAEPGVAEWTLGHVITALNEEAVVCAALGNRSGLNLVVTYEAFGVKMLGALRQALVFSRHERAVGRPAGWISVPVLLSSHTWENGKNEMSHQDPTLCEALMQEMSDVSRVSFPADANSAVAVLQRAYQTRGEIWTMVVPKGSLPHAFAGAEATALAEWGAAFVSGAPDAPVQLVAVGAYQLQEILRASRRLHEAQVEHSVLYLLEPGRFRVPRDDAEARFTHGADIRAELFPAETAARIVLTHTRPEPLLGVLRAVDLGPRRMRVLGFLNRGGTLDVRGMLLTNRCTWRHVLYEVSRALERPPEELLEPKERPGSRREAP